MTTSCQKDNLYIVEVNDTVDTNDDIEKISSIIIVSDDYSSGIPAIEMNNIYTYITPQFFNDTQTSTFTSNYQVAVSKIDVKVNPSNASLDDVEWRVVRRSATTKAIDGEEFFAGDIVAVRSETAPELVILNIGDDTDGFFDADGGYVYSVVAIHSDDAQVTSDVATLAGGNDIAVARVFLGLEVDGELINYSEEVVLTSNSLVVDKPELYGVLDNGDVLSFEKMGIGDNQYSLYACDYPYMTTSTLSIMPLEYESEMDPTFTCYQWLISVHSVFGGYNYDEFNVRIGIQYVFSDAQDNIIDPFMVSRFSTYIGDVDLSSEAVVSSSSLTFGVFLALGENLLMERIVGDNNSYIAETFLGNYCNTNGYANDPKFYIDGVESTNMSLDYGNPFNLQLTINDSLTSGTYEIKVVLSCSIDDNTTLTEKVTLTVE